MPLNEETDRIAHVEYRIEIVLSGLVKDCISLLELAYRDVIVLVLLLGDVESDS
jgi:hypothetical protein